MKKCDLHKEACGQCVRAGLVCSGYRDPDQLRIRDESRSIKQKVLFGRPASVPQVVQEPLDQVAKAAFFSHYVQGSAKTYDVLERIGKQATLDKHLEASLEAVSLAFFFFQFYSTQAVRFAREKYLSALPLVKRAVGSTESLASDSTLLAVLFLDLYEKILNNNPRSSDSWMSHVRGAMAIMKLREPEQLKTYIGLRLSVRLFTNMLISCVAGDAPLPSELTKLRSQLEPYLNPQDPKWQVSVLVMKYADLRGATQKGLLSISASISQAKKLDSEFSSLANNLPLSWIHRRISTSRQSDRVLERYYDVYPDIFTTQTCNVIRIMRILLNDTIRRAYLDSAPDNDDVNAPRLQVECASRIIDDMARGICATGPQYTGAEKVPWKIDEFSLIRKLRCYTLLFPFYVAGLYASFESNVRIWVIEQLKFISTNFGIQNAAIVAEMMEKNDGTSPWSVYAILGSYAFAA